MGTEFRQFYHFGSFRIDVAERQLLMHDQPIALTAKAFDLLLFLVRHSGETVEKDDILRAVWHGTFVEEGNLSQHISTLRRVLGDDSRSQRLIKTIPKQGYRFTADVREVAGDWTDSVAERRITSPMRVTEGRREFFFSRRPAVMGALLLIAIVLLGAWAVSSSVGSMNRKSDALFAYRQGRELWNDRRATSLHDATVLLERAVELDPQFALAHAALADAYAFDYTYWRKAETEARKAIDLDPTIGEPHASIGFIRMYWEWDLTSAEDELRKAVDLSPEYATGRQWYALALAASGHVDAAHLEIQRALDLAPNSVAINADQCQILYYQRRYTAALRQCQKTLGLDPTNTAARELMFEILASMDQMDAAVATLTENLRGRQTDNDAAAASRLEQAYGKGGRTAFYTALLDFYSQTAPHVDIARIYARSGKFDEAFEHLTLAYDRHEFDFVTAQAEPVFGPMHSEPRFLTLVAKLKRN